MGDALAVGDAFASAVVTSGAQTIEEKVEFLLRRDEETQRHLNAIHTQLQGLPARWEKNIATIAKTLRDEQRDAIASLRAEHLQARTAGVILTLFGVGVLTLANVA